jgi:osmotically-inducible protein OsmY
VALGPWVNRASRCESVPGQLALPVRIGTAGAAASGAGEDQMQVEVSRADAKADLSRAIERRIRQRTSGRVGSLQVEVRDGDVIVRGCTTSFYVKQLAIHACLEVLGDSAVQLAVAIDVTSGVRSSAS